MKNYRTILFAGFIAMCFSNGAQGQWTAFTYQGVLRDGTALANGSYDLRFVLFDVEAFGFPVGPIRTNGNVAVSNGLFTATLDFGAGAFEGAERWLEIGVRPGGTAGSFTTLSPRTPLRPTPYALFAPMAGRAATATNALSAGSVPWTGITGIPAGFSDGVDNNTTYGAGVGLSLSGTTFSVAPGGIGSNQLADGAVTSLKLAADSVTGAHIRFGAIGESHLAPGAIGPGALEQPYQSGRVSLESYVPLFFGGVRRVNQFVEFPRPFSSLPTITLAMETPHSSAAKLIHPIIVRNKTTADFELSFPLPNIPLTLAHRDNFGLAPLAMINGQPALVFDSAGVRYMRALDSTGLRWPATSVRVDPAVSASRLALLAVNGRPAVVYVENGPLDIKFVRANDATGTSWGAPAVIVTNITATDISPAIVGGRPAIAYWDVATDSIWYVRSLDADGNAWAAPVSVGAGNVGVSLLSMNSGPAISYGWDNGQPVNSASYTNQLRFIRATDINGTAWSAPATIRTYGPLQQVFQTKVLMVSNNPAIFFVLDLGSVSSSPQPMFIRATNATATGWGLPTFVTGGGVRHLVGSYTAAIVNGQPAIGWHDSSSGAIVYSVSQNNGVSFNTMDAYEHVERFSLSVSLLDVQGEPALSFSDGMETMYLREGTPVADTYINWIAVEP